MIHEKGRRLVVGTARADAVDELVEAAAEIAARCGAALHVVHAFEGRRGRGVAEPRLPGAHAARLRATLSTALAGAGIDATVEVVQGAAGPLLCRAAEEHGAELVVVGATRQLPGFQHLLGSTAERVLREATVPVLVLRGPIGEGVSRALYTTDLSPHSMGAIVRGRALVECVFGRPEREECLLVAGYGLGALPPLRGRTLEEVAEVALREFAGRVPGAVPLVTRVRTGNPAKEIVAAAAALSAQLTVLGTHARTGAERFYLGSVAEQVLRTTLTHALVVPTGARARDAVERAVEHAAGAA